MVYIKRGNMSISWCAPLDNSNTHLVNINNVFIFNLFTYSIVIININKDIKL